MASEEAIFIFLLNELIDVWRPVNALKLSKLRYRIVGTRVVLVDEEWEFQIGNVVRCEERTFKGGGSGLVAVAASEMICGVRQSSTTTPSLQR